ncbi:MAG: radical SAM-associated putative lipoprotein [Tannerellaceae bacterium]|nr:radical SAM-associated putative lipoprotein [Tannerellaceae bacterium]
MKKEYRLWINILCGWMAGIAFSCSSGGDIDLDADMATANYIIQGTVVSEKDTALPIPGLQVIISHATPHPSADTLYTANDGKFGWERPVSTFGKDLAFDIIVTDIDDEENNRYAPQTIRISFSKDEFDTETSWFMGEARKEVFIRMKEHATPENE